MRVKIEDIVYGRDGLIDATNRAVQKSSATQTHDELMKSYEEAQKKKRRVDETGVDADADGEEALDIAVNAYLSYVGAYAVHSKETRQIFQLRSLHLGRVARSFGPEGAAKAGRQVGKIQRSTAGEEGGLQGQAFGPGQKQKSRRRTVFGIRRDVSVHAGILDSLRRRATIRRSRIRLV